MGFLKKHRVLFTQAILLVVATILLSININRPLVDYDEATYAKVIVDTIKTGDISTFVLSGRDWFEKPPLYLWIVIGLIKVLGTGEFVFRIPSILFSVLSIWVVYLLVREPSRLAHRLRTGSISKPSTICSTPSNDANSFAFSNFPYNWMP